MADSDDPTLHQTVLHATQDFARQKIQDISQHPSDQEMLDYQEGRLDTDEAEILRQHLSLCRSCANDILELEEWDSSLTERGEAPPIPISMAKRRHAFEEWSAREEEALEKEVPEGPRRQRQMPFFLAAGWAVATLVLGFLLGSLGPGSQSKKSSDPPATANHPFLVDLVPDGATPVRTAQGTDIEVPAGMNPLVLRLNLGSAKPYDRYRAELMTIDGKAVWHQDKLTPQPEGSFVVFVDLERVTPGTYRLILVGQTAEAETRLAIYSFEMSRSPSS